MFFSERSCLVFIENKKIVIASDDANLDAAVSAEWAPIESRPPLINQAAFLSRQEQMRPFWVPCPRFGWSQIIKIPFFQKMYGIVLATMVQ